MDMVVMVLVVVHR